MSAALRARTEHRILVVQGEFHISSSPDVILSTLLGSCVAVCLYDPVACVGGMNHFLLPGTEREADGSAPLRYGAHAMELLVNGLLKRGAQRGRLEAKLFGGARMLAGLTDLGKRNAEFACEYVRRENIAFKSGSLRGERGRRVEFWPHSGRTRQLWIGNSAAVFASESYVAPAPEPGTVELF
ncbi:MAG TPA: chemotaxis protein CheD [Acetobacteraceae bacterium]|jgi:chemotaxis protein CheD|nr:chemotaxis protein CheD [Acetobacteraceae bacterium]